jgi:hypothetical protein
VLDVTTIPAPAGQSLTDLAEQIRIEHKKAEAALATSLAHAMAAGDLLIKAKAQLPKRGKWEEWIEQNCEFALRTAQLYTRLAKNRETIESKTQHVALLDLSVRGAIELISVPQPKAQRVALLSSPKAAKPAEKIVDHDELWRLWDRLPSAERRGFFEKIGLIAILEAIPETWKRRVNEIVVQSNWKPWAEMPADRHDGDDLAIPTFLWREPERVH